MATDAVYKYLKMQNRPYNLNDIVTNLHSEFGKNVVQKAVDKLISDGKVFEKVYGKQKIYCIVQDSQYDTEELLRINKELEAHAIEVENKYQDIQKEIKVQERILSDLKSNVTIEEAMKERHALMENIHKLTNKLDELMEASGTEDLSESRRKAQSALDEYSRAYSQRKRICMDILNCILENYPGSKNELYEEIGIEAKFVE